MYSFENPSDGVKTKAFVFFDEILLVTKGACVFRFREYTNFPHHWVMQWVWIHPYLRNENLLSRYTSVFNREFEYWYPEKPFSKGMKCFIDKNKLISPEEYFKIKKNK